MLLNADIWYDILIKRVTTRDGIVMEPQGEGVRESKV